MQPPWWDDSNCPWSDFTGVGNKPASVDKDKQWGEVLYKILSDGYKDALGPDKVDNFVQDPVMEKWDVKSDSVEPPAEVPFEKPVEEAPVDVELEKVEEVAPPEVELEKVVEVAPAEVELENVEKVAPVEVELERPKDIAPQWNIANL